MTDFDVAIVGYGPTGMALAALLGRAGRRVLVLERYRGRYNLPRAACFDDETMRTFQKLEIAEAMLPGTNVQKGYEWLNADGQTLISIEYDNPGHSGWPQLYMMYQPHMEDVLHDCVTALDRVEIRSGTAVRALEQDAERVTIRAVDDEGAAQTFTARYAVGADGGNGVVRQSLNVAMDDYGFFENWLVCDFRMRRKVEAVPSFRQVCDPTGPHSIVNIGPNHHRFSFMLDPDDDQARVTRPENVWRRVADYITPDDAELIRVANYTFRSKIAESWRRGRILLAGDAAHEMPPFLAQGMVSGIRDARNLAWKLDLVLSGIDDALLDTYQPEREPHVRFITEKAIELGRVQTMRDPGKAAERDARMLAARRANQAPDKLRYPPLKGGMIANHGELLPQGRVDDGTRTALFDDIAGTGWLIVARDGSVVSALDGERGEMWRSLDGRTVVFGDALTDTDGVFTRWFDAADSAVAIVRPDSHVFGLARDGRGLAALLDDLRAALGVVPAVG